MAYGASRKGDLDFMVALFAWSSLLVDDSVYWNFRTG